VVIAGGEVTLGDAIEVDWVPQTFVELGVV
jgi:hypothetical protein